MPLYEFECEKCKNTQEELIFSKEEKIRCDKCGGRLKKIISRPNGYVKNTKTPTKS